MTGVYVGLIFLAALGMTYVAAAKIRAKVFRVRLWRFAIEIEDTGRPGADDNSGGNAPSTDLQKPDQTTYG